MHFLILCTVDEEFDSHPSLGSASTNHNHLMMQKKDQDFKDILC